MLIRKATIIDSSDIQRLSLELGYNSSVRQIEERISYLSGKPLSFLFVADDNDIVKGFISFEHYEPVYYEAGLNISGLVVSEQYRNRGIGKELLNYAKSYALDNALKYLRLNSGSQRIEAHKFYRKYGFDNEKEQKRFILNL